MARIRYLNDNLVENYGNIKVLITDFSQSIHKPFIIIWQYKNKE
jgi:hypothetical protein